MSAGAGLAPVLTPNLDAIPATLKALPCWVAWRAVPKADDNIKVDKIPVNPATGGNASTTALSTWGTFDAAVKRCQTDRLAGVGIVFSPEHNGLAGIDLDHCRDRDTNTLAPWAAKVVEGIASYAEVSPSGTGIKIIVRGPLPGKGGKRTVEGREVEMYERGRFFTVTGHAINAAGVNGNGDAVRALHAEYFGARKTTKKNTLPKDAGDAQDPPHSDKIEQGGRATTLVSIAGAMRKRGMAPKAIEAALLAHNDSTCNPPLPESEVHDIAFSMGRYAPTVTPPPITYYDREKRDYLIQNERDIYLALSETQYRRYLRKAGLRDKADDTEFISPIDAHLINLQQRYDVAFAGPLAGYLAGIHDVEGDRILVTSSPTIIQPVKGDFKIIWALVNNLLDDESIPGDQYDQATYFFGWLKVGYEALRAGSRRAGQALALCGPRDAGKNLLQDWIITKIFGGRSARPYQYMAGVTPFNKDLHGAEHLVIADQESSHDIRTRRAFGAAIKDFTVNEGQRLHAKGRDAITTKPFWRVSISLNDEPENLLVLPPIDEGLEDKIMLLRCKWAPMPMPTTTLKERAAFTTAIENELPAFIHHLVNDFAIPPALACRRFGIKHFHHPDILSAISHLAPETQLLNLIDAEVFPNLTTAWVGTAEELGRLLTADNSGVRFEARNLLKYPSYTGAYLGRLAKRPSPRVAPSRTTDRREWVIQPEGA